MPQFLFRFDQPREHQDRMMSDIYNALSEKKSMLINAPTGIGKTDASIAAALTVALEKNLNVFFLTPKISQHKIALDSVAGISRKFGVDIRYIDMVGKRNLCVNEKVNSIEGEAFYRSCDALVKSKRCTFYNLSKEKGKVDEVRASALEGHNRFFSACFDSGVCGYEAAAEIAKESNFIIADYAHILNPYTRKAFLKRIGHKLENAIVIWDEAHNVVGSASSYLSTSLSVHTVNNAIKELREIQSSMDIEYLRFMIESIAAKRLPLIHTGEAFFDGDEVASMLTGNIANVVEDLEKAGMEYLSNATAKRSSLMHIARFLESLSGNDASSARILSKRGTDIKLSVVCLYPEGPLAALKEAYANVFMSGTLLPLEMYRELLGMPDAGVSNYSSPFPPLNKLCMVDDQVSTKYQNRSLEEYKKIANKIGEIKGPTKGNVAVFFPSFDVLNAVYQHMIFEVEFIQRREMHNVAVEEMINKFKASKDSLMFGVMGGSLSEGIDYANNVIKGIVIVGIPLERPDLELTAKIEYLDKRFNGKGNEYAYIVPGVIRAAQAAGRAIRSESDRAFVIFMDKRYNWRLYNNIISNFVTIKKSDNYLKEITRFTEQKSEKIVKSS